VDNVSILDNLGEYQVSCCSIGKNLKTYIILSFLSVLPGSLDWGHGLAAFAKIMEVLVRDYFGFDESPLKIAVDSSGSLWC
jgi:hypothetical protein